MSWIILLTSAIKLIAVFFSTWREKDKRRKELKKKALKDLKDGIKERDPSKVTAAFDAARRV